MDTAKEGFELKSKISSGLNCHLDLPWILPKCCAASFCISFPYLILSYTCLLQVKWGSASVYYEIRTDVPIPAVPPRTSCSSLTHHCGMNSNSGCCRLCYQFANPGFGHFRAVQTRKLQIPLCLLGS